MPVFCTCHAYPYGRKFCAIVCISLWLWIGVIPFCYKSLKSGFIFWVNYLLKTRLCKLSYWYQPLFIWFVLFYLWTQKSLVTQFLCLFSCFLCIIFVLVLGQAFCDLSLRKEWAGGQAAWISIHRQETQGKIQFWVSKIFFYFAGLITNLDLTYFNCNIYKIVLERKLLENGFKKTLNPCVNLNKNNNKIGTFRKG